MHSPGIAAMSLEQLNFIFQILASCAVVVSLLYLAVQTRQTARNQQAQMHAMRLQSIREDVRRLSDPEFQPVYRAGMAADADLTPDAATQFMLMAYSLMISFQEQFHQFQEGMISARRWEPSKHALRRQLMFPGFRAAFATYRMDLDPTFVALVVQLLAELKTAPVMQSTYVQWKQHADEERAAMTATA